MSRKGWAIGIGTAIVVFGVIGHYSEDEEAPETAREQIEARNTALPAYFTEDAITPEPEPAPEKPESGSSSGGDYDRDEFGSGWDEVGGCSVRHLVLKRDLDDVEVSSNGCTVLSGTLEDPYTGETVHYSIEDPLGVQIDHRVPLAAAWRMGADGWSDGEREDFANDMGNLTAVEGSVNQSKSDSGPSEWLPEQNQCEYLNRYEEIVEQYGLEPPEEDIDELERC